MKRNLFITDKKAVLWAIIVVVTACLLMALVELILSPTYMIKSIYKIVLFLLLPFGYVLCFKRSDFKKLFIPDKRSLIIALAMGAAVYILILGAYFTLGRFFDFSQVTSTLEERLGVMRGNFVFVAIYISLINSFLEEFFFRGFSFLILKKSFGRKLSYIFSAGAFSLYHVAIITGWFTPLLFILLIIALFIAGIIFNWFCEKSNTIYPSWLIHMCANFAINTIGFMLFGIM